MEVHRVNNRVSSKRAEEATKTYLANNAGHLLKSLAKHRGGIRSQDKEAVRRINQCAQATKHLKDIYGVRWHNCRLLDIGCGQLLRQALIFGVDNHVVGVDMELPFRYPYISDFCRTVKQSGTLRAVKTLSRQLLAIDYKYRQSLIRHMGLRKLPRVETYCMNATRLQFPNRCFDGVYSFSVFQHINKPELAGKEMYRVLKYGGVAYIQIHLYTSMTGSDHPLLQSLPVKYTPWGHLRPSSPYYGKDGLYLNRWRLAQYKEMFQSVFDEVHYVNIDDEPSLQRSYLTPRVRAELIDYTDEELLTTTLTVICRKAE